MKLRGAEPERVLEDSVRAPARNGWRPRGAFERSGRWALKILMLVALVAAGAWAYWANVSSKGSGMDMSMRVTSGATPFPVAVDGVGRGPITGSVVYTGSVVPFNEEDIYPRVTGRIVDMMVYPGDAVRQGQAIARLDSVELSSRAREAEAGLATAQANRAQMEADQVAARQAVVQMQKELAMVDAELVYVRSLIARTERLLGVGAVSQQEYESDRSMAASLEAKREAAVAKLEQARAQETAAKKKLEAGDAMVSQAGAALHTATVVRDYVNIAAPSSGYVVKRLVAPGVLVQPGMAILKIAQVDRVRLQANVGEKDVASIRVGSPVTVTPAGTGQAAVTARVSSVFPFIDQGPRTAVVEAVLDNSGRRFLPGQYVLMQFETGARPEALSVPRGAVARLGGKARVWVTQAGRAEPREVTTGLETPERVEIVSGLTGAERVITRGHDGLYAGARVNDVAAAGAGKGHAGHGGATPGMGDAKPSDPAPEALKPDVQPMKPDMPMEPKPPASKGGGHAGH